MNVVGPAWQQQRNRGLSRQHTSGFVQLSRVRQDAM